VEDFTEKVTLERQLSPKKKSWASRREKVILLSFDKTVELVKCIREMKGKSEIGSYFSFKHTEKGSEIVQCGM